MEIGPVDQALFLHIRQILKSGCRRGKTTAHVKGTELLWAGQHYILVREGPESGGERYTSLWRREYLLLDRGSPERNPMVELALATIDPVHHEWTANRRRYLHSTKDHHGLLEQFKGRRWCNKLVADLIEFSKNEDRLFPEREQAESTKFNAGNLFSQQTVARAQSFGLSIQGTLEENGVAFPIGHEYSVSIRGQPTHLRGLRFTPRADRTIDVKLSETEMDTEEFEVILEAIARIETLKRKKELLPSGTGSLIT